MCIRIIRMAVSKKVSNAAFAHAPICSKTQTKMQESAIIVGANGGCPNFQGPKSHNSGNAAWLQTNLMCRVNIRISVA